jgi:hypothetical protein
VDIRAQKYTQIFHRTDWGLPISGARSLATKSLTKQEKTKLGALVFRRSGSFLPASESREIEELIITKAASERASDEKARAGVVAAPAVAAAPTTDPALRSGCAGRAHTPGAVRACWLHPQTGSALSEPSTAVAVAPPAAAAVRAPPRIALAACPPNAERETLSIRPVRSAARGKFRLVHLARGMTR